MSPPELRARTGAGAGAGVGRKLTADYAMSSPARWQCECLLWRLRGRIWYCRWRILRSRQPDAPWMLLAVALWPLLWLAARLRME